MRVLCLRFLLQFSVAAGVAVCVEAQPGCPAVNFQVAVSANLLPSTSSHIDLLRQNDGSYTAYEIANQPPFRMLRTTPNYQKQLTACLPSQSALQPLAPPAGFGNVPGAPSQPQAFARLNSGNYVLVNPDFTNPSLVSTVVLFDPELNFISQSQLPLLVQSPILADVNGDGIADLVGITLSPYGNLGQGSVVLEILLGKEDGTFTVAATYQLAGNSYLSATLAVADLNGDHKPDVVVASQGLFQTGKVSVLLGNGDGTFQAERAVAYSDTAAPYAVAIADLNGDGKADLAFTEGGQSNANFLAVALGNGDGTFATPATYQISDSKTLAIGDLNGDGIPDIVTSGVSTFWGDGTGKFPKRLDYLVADMGDGIILADVDGDGRTDIVEGAGNALVLSPGTTSSSGSFSVLFARGDGTFLGPEVRLVSPSLFGATLASADFNGDGIPDLVAAVAPSFGSPGNSTGIMLLPGDGKGGFAEAFQYDFRGTGPGIVAVVVADFNYDGKPDFAVGTQNADVNSPGTIAVFLGRGDGTFQPPITTTIPAGAIALATGDFNGDGKPDLAAVVLPPGQAGQAAGSPQPGTLLIYLGSGNGTFAAPVSYSAGDGPDWVVSGDFNNDGKVDLVVGTVGSEDSVGGVNLFLGNGNGTFTAGTSTQLGRVSDFAAGDFNRDGKLDLAVPTESGLTVLLGHGDGTFGPPAAYAATGSSALIGDLNGDGIPDLIVATAYLLGNGDGTFQQAAPLPINFGSESFPISLIAADLNRDGKIDLVEATAAGVVSFLNISQVQPAVTVVSSASFAVGPAAPESLATACGNNLAASTATAPVEDPFPATLGRTTVSVQDASGTTRPAELLYVSPGQVNFVVPPGTSAGTATVTITNTALIENSVPSAQLQILPVAPSMFTFNTNGLAAAYVTLVGPGQSQTYESVFSLLDGTPVAAPINLGPASDRVYLTLFGTGLRNAGAGGVAVDIQGLSAPVSSAGPQAGIDGLDQVTVLLPRALAGSGDVNIVVTAGGITANTVQVTIQ